MRSFGFNVTNQLSLGVASTVDEGPEGKIQIAWRMWSIQDRSGGAHIGKVWIMGYRGLSIVAASMRLSASYRERLRFQVSQRKAQRLLAGTGIQPGQTAFLSISKRRPMLAVNQHTAITGARNVTGCPGCNRIRYWLLRCALPPDMCVMPDMAVYMVSTGSSLSLPKQPPIFIHTFASGRWTRHYVCLGVCQGA